MSSSLSEGATEPAVIDDSMKMKHFFPPKPKLIASLKWKEAKPRVIQQQDAGGPA